MTFLHHFRWWSSTPTLFFGSLCLSSASTLWCCYVASMMFWFMTWSKIPADDVTTLQEHYHIIIIRSRLKLLVFVLSLSKVRNYERYKHYFGSFVSLEMALNPPFSLVRHSTREETLNNRIPWCWHSSFLAPLTRRTFDQSHWIKSLTICRKRFGISELTFVRITLCDVLRRKSK